MLARLRRFYWQRVRRYAYEICDACGRPVERHIGSYWFAASDFWNEIMGGPVGVRCPACFAALCWEADRGIGWFAAPIGDLERVVHPLTGARPDGTFGAGSEEK